MRAEQLPADEFREKTGILSVLQRIQICRCVPADVAVLNHMPGVAHITLKTVIPLDALHVIYLKQTGDFGMSLGIKMLSQQIASVIIVILNAYGPGERRITAVQED